MNARCHDEMQMRVGIPHRGGQLAIHAFKSDYPVMVSANAFFNRKTQRFRLPQHSPLQDMDVALDSAGFVAMQLFKSKGRQNGVGGMYPWSYSDYLELAVLMRPSWYSAMDLCTEPEVTNGGLDTAWRIRATATMLEGTLQILDAWQCEYAKDVSATTVTETLKPPVPVVQGWTLQNYLPREPRSDDGSVGTAPVVGLADAVGPGVRLSP
ncbi:hypothetical protein P5W99_36300 [Paraburkholderia sp. A3BS-1L]|uniref:hypothetical protein n=1 Tax=Paraburkholderia sp. A3BS-1L TaxID=3028375 RepID=UPI003DA96D98